MAEIKLLIIHPNEQYCEQVAQAFLQYDPDIEVTPVVDLRDAPERVKAEKPAAVVVGVDTPHDPALSTIETISGMGEELGIIVVSKEPTRELLVSCMRAGSDEFLEFPIDPDELAKAMGGLLKRKGILARGQGQVVAVFSSSGGAGVTTIACNVAVGVARALNSPTASCILDMNLQFGCVALALDILEFSHTLADAAHEEQRLDENLLRNFMSTHESGLSVLPAPLSLEDAESVDSWRLRGVIQTCRSTYDFTFLDLPHSVDERSVVGLDEADQILLICDMLLPSIRRTIRATELFSELGYKRDKIKLVINRYYDSHEVSLDEIARHVNHPIHWLVPYESRSVMNSLNSGQTLDLVAPNSEVARSLAALARVTAGLTPEPARSGRRRKSLLGWLRS